MVKQINCGIVNVIGTGKITIPVEVRKEYNIQKGDRLQLILEEVKNESNPNKSVNC